MAEHLYRLRLATVPPRSSVYKLCTALRDIRHSTAPSLSFSCFPLIHHQPLAIGSLHSSLASQTYGLQSWGQISNNSEAGYSTFQYPPLQRNRQTSGPP